MRAPPAATASPVFVGVDECAVHPGEVDPEPDRHAHGESDDELVGESDPGVRRQHDQNAEEQAAQPEHERKDGAEHDTALASEGTAPPHAERHPHEREHRQRGQRQHRAEDDLRDRAVAERGREVDRRSPVERRVDAAAVEERVDQPVAGRRLVRPEVVRVADVRQHDLVAVRQLRQELTRRVLRRRRDVEPAADQERLDVRAPDAGVQVLVRARRPRVEETAAGRDELGAGAADHRPAVGTRREEGSGVGGVCPADRGDVAPYLGAREDRLRHQRQQPRTGSVAVVGGEQRVDRPRPVQRPRAVGGRMHETRRMRRA